MKAHMLKHLMRQLGECTLQLRQGQIQSIVVHTLVRALKFPEKDLNLAEVPKRGC